MTAMPEIAISNMDGDPVSTYTSLLKPIILRPALITPRWSLWSHVMISAYLCYVRRYFCYILSVHAQIVTILIVFVAAESAPKH